MTKTTDSQVKTDRSSRRSFMKLGALSVASTLCVPRELFALYENSSEGRANDVVLRCAVMSDVHFNGSADAKEVERFKRSIDFMYDYSSKQAYKNFDALVVVGDMSNHGIEKELGLFKKTMDEAVREGTAKFLCMGNHEFYGGNHALWQKIFGVEPNKRYEANGFRFIAISPEKGTMADGDYNYKVDWLDAELADAYKQDPKKPIFVFQHYPVSPTVYGGRGWDDWGAEDLFDTLQKYPTVVDFSGHTHYPINDPRCAWQGCFSAFGTGTLSYLCHGHEGHRFQKYFADDYNHGQFYVMEVRKDNSVTLKPYDLTNNKFFDVVYFVAEPGALDKYEYTDARYSTSEKPTWQEGANVSCVDIDFDAAFIEFPQAVCKDVVVGYRAELERFDAKENAWEGAGTRHFWSLYYLTDQPKIARGELSALDSDTKYRGRVVALNPFMRESEQKIAFAFQTKPDPNGEVDKTTPAPNANFLDIRVVDGKVVNEPETTAPKKTLQKFGAPKVVHDDELGIDVVEFNGKDSYYKAQCTSNDYRGLKRATIAARFKLASDHTGSNAIFGNTQLAGIELSYSSEDKKLKLWASVNGAYHVLETSIDTDKYVDAYGSYDGKTVALFINGKEVAREDAVGVLTHPTKEAVQAFCFGSDIADGGLGEAFFKGRIARAKIYSWALTPEQIANLSK